MRALLAHLRKFDWIAMTSVAFLLSFGVLYLYAFGKNNPSLPSYFSRQIFFIGIGIFVMLATSFINYRVLVHRRTILWCYLVGLVALGAVLIFGSEVRGSRAWFQIGGFNIQPVEFVKIILILLLAKFFAYRHVESYRFANLLVSGMYVLVPTAFVLLQPDFGSGLVLMALWGGIMVFVGIRPLHLIGLLLVSSLIFVLGWNFVFQPYQKERFLTFLNPANDPFGSGYNLVQAKIAIGSGGLFGRGLGNGIQTQLRFLPESHTDFILAAVGEEMGLIGIAAIFTLFTVLLFRFMRVAQNAHDNFATLFCFGFSLVMAVHFFINTAMTLGFFPVTGLSLPFVSYGGSSLISLFLGLGIIQSIKVRTA